MKKIAVLVGSLSDDSINKKLAKLVERELPKDVEFEFIDLEIFPFFSSQKEKDYPPEIAKAKNVIRNSAGVIIFTPEYNRSIPGVLKNAIDWLSRPNVSENPFREKKIMILGASTGKIGTALAQKELKYVMIYLGAKIFPKELYLASSDIFEHDGISSGSKEFIMKNIKEYSEAI